jgi:hypothetical protein
MLSEVGTETRVSKATKMSNDALKIARLEAREKDKERIVHFLDKTLDIGKDVATHPVTILVGGFLAVDYFEQKQRTKRVWRDDVAPYPGAPHTGGYVDLATGETYLGPVAAAALRTGLVATAALSALGPEGVKSVAGVAEKMIPVI